MSPNPTGHPARFSDEIVDEFRKILQDAYPEWLGRPVLFDPFAGTGEALAALAAELDFPYGGVELQPEWINATNIVCGDATDLKVYPPPPFVIITSPTYPNGMADSWVATDDSERNTYQWRLDRLVGKHVEMHPNNQAQYGYRGTKRGGKSKRRSNYWRVAEAAVVNWRWADMILLNVSDFKHSNGQREPLVMDWRWLLKENGWLQQIEIGVDTRRNRNGANADQRVEHEVIVVAKR